MRNGAGTYNLPQAPFTPGTVISSTAVNSNFSDIANALTQSLANDGQTVPTANLPMGTYRHTGVGNAVARTDYAAMGQVQDGAGIWCGTAGGTANALTLTPSPAITAYAAGQVFRFTAGAAANTGATTVAVSGLTAQAVQASGAALTSGQIAAGRVYQIVYDGANFQLSSISASPGTTANSLVQLDSSARLPAVDGSQLTNLGGGTATITAGENLADRDLIYQDVFDQRGGGATRWYKVDADATGPVLISPRIGIALAAITSGNTGSAQVRAGRVSGFVGLTAGQPVYASGTAGIVTQTAPAIPASGTQIASRMIGYAASTTEIDFDPDDDTIFTARNSALTVGSTITVQHWTDSGAADRTPFAYLVQATSATQIAQGAGTTIGNMTNAGGLAAAFDGVLSQAEAACAQFNSASGNATVGKDWGSGVTRTITRYRIRTPNNRSDFCSGGGSATMELQGSTDNFSSSTVVLHSGTTGTPGADTWVDTTSGITTTTAYRYHRVVIGTAGGGARNVAEVEFYEAGTARDEPIGIGSASIDASATNLVTVRNDDGAGANAATRTTFANRTNATRDIAVEVVL